MSVGAAFDPVKRWSSK